MYPAVSNFAKEVDSAFYWIGGICVALLVGITAALKKRHGLVKVAWITPRPGRSGAITALPVQGLLQVHFPVQAGLA